MLCSSANGLRSFKDNPTAPVETPPAQAVKDDPPPKQAPFRSVIQFKVTESSIETGKCSESSEIKLEDVAWKIQLCKRETGDNDNKKIVADIFLVSAFTDETSKWSCEAKADFVLKNISTENGEIKKTLDQKKFTISTPKYGHESFVDWDNFKNNYAKDVATFEITLDIMPPNRVPQLDQISTVFYFKVPDVHRYTSPNGTRSKDVNLRGVNWHYKAMKAKNKKGEDTFAIYLYANQDDMDLNYQWKTNTTITLISTKKEKNVSRSIAYEYHWRDLVFGYTEFLDWKTFIADDNGYVVSDGAIFQIALKVEEPTLLSP